MNTNNSKVKKEVGQVHLSNRAIETSAQISQVLQVIGIASSALNGLQRHIAYDEGEKGLQPVMTEGQIAVENTLCTACERMDKILKEDSRWSDEFQRKVEKEYNELHALQMDAIALQRAAAAEVTSPHFRYRPELQRLKNGQWLAILGNVEQLEFSIYGIGDTAQQALEEFDHVFTKGVPKSMADFCAEREADMNAGRPLKQFPNQEEQKTNDDTKLDGTRSGEGPQPPA